MITGDNKLTAEAICRKIGVFGVEGNLEDKSLTGRQFVELPLDQRRAILDVSPIPLSLLSFPFRSLWQATPASEVHAPHSLCRNRGGLQAVGCAEDLP